MKQIKIFFAAILIAMSVSFTVAAADTSAVDTTTVVEPPTKTQEVERLVDKYGGKIVDGFNSIVEKATPIAKDGFKVAVKLQIAKGVAGLLPLILTVFFIVYCFKFNKDAIWRHDGPSNASAVLVIVFAIIAIIIGLFAISSTYNAILYLIAPEWFAIQDIINLLK